MPIARIRVRSYRSEDLPALSRVYADAIRHLGPEYYSAEQVAAWSSFADEDEEFRHWAEKAKTLVAIDARDLCVGFGGLEDHGRISSLFVSPGHQRRGIGAQILAQLIREAQARGLPTLTTEASEFSRPLFEAFGFRVLEIEHTEVKGVKFSRYAMQLDQ